MKRSHQNSSSGTRNSDYYVKKIKPANAKGSSSIVAFFKKKDSNQNVSEESIVRDDVQSPPETSVSVDDTMMPSSSCSSQETFNEIIPEIPESPLTEENLPEKGKLPLNVERYEQLHNWLYYSISAKGFLCKICSVLHQSGPWIDQAAKFGDHPNRCIKKHESSTRHKQAVASSKHATTKSLQDSFNEGSEKIAEKKEESNRKLLTKYIKIIYFMIKKNWAITENFASLVKFIGEDLAENEIQTYLGSCGKNATYLSNTSIDNFVEAISLFLEEKTVTALRLIDSFALLADECTDESQREQLGLIVRYKIKEMPGFKEEYLGLINLTSVKAESITDAIEKFMIAKGINIVKCLFLALDGANVMSGEISGVQRRIRHLSPHCIYINCRNHRLALIFSHLIKKHDLLQDVDALLVSLWKLFHYSPMKQQVFKDIQEDVYNIEILKTLKVSVTRWLSHGLACERVISRYRQLVETLDALFVSKREPELKGLREQLLNPDVLLGLLFLSDFLKIINKLSLCLQSSSILFGSLKEKVARICKEVDELSTNLDKGENFKKAEELLTFATECTQLSMKRRSNKNQDVFDSILNFKNDFVPQFIADFKTEISMAFAISNETLNAFDLFGTLDIDHLMPGNLDQTCFSVLLSFYGQKQTNEFQGAVKVSPAYIDAVAAQKEKDIFDKEMSLAKVTFDINKSAEAKALLKLDKKEDAKKWLEKKPTSTDVLDIIEKESANWNLFPNLLKLLTLSVIIPASTAPVERLFSKMNLICTELRSRMKQETLDRHLRIVLNGPEKLTDAECSEIIDIFKSTGNRRILLYILFFFFFSFYLYLVLLTTIFIFNYYSLRNE